MFLADFHVHSTFSDGKLTIPQVIDLYGHLGFGAIAITDHLCETQSFLGKASAYLGCSLTKQNFSHYLDTIAKEGERAWRQYKMRVIPGVEFTKNSITNHRSAHVVGLGIHRYIDPDVGIPEICEQIRAQGGLSIAAHPVWTRKLEKQTFFIWDHRAELLPCFDAWEVASGPYIFPKVAETNLPKIASSDLHHARQIHAWKTELTCAREIPAILEDVRKQKIDFRFFECKDVSKVWPMFGSRRTGFDLSLAKNGTY